MSKYIDPYKNINDNIKKLINEALSGIAKSLPCRVKEVKGNKVKVERLLSNNNITGFIDDVPIIRSIYFSYPIKQGDLGILIISNYPYESYIKDHTSPAKELNINNDGAGYLFLPLAADNIDFVKNNEALELYSMDGKTSIVIDDNKIEINDNAGGEDDGDNNNIIIDKNGIKILDKNKNEIIISSSGIILKDLNDNTIEMTSNSVKINNNLEVLK